MSDGDVFRIPVGPGTLHVERFGYGGPAVALIHGFATCSFLWRFVAPAIARRQQTAFAVDLLGHGESDRPFATDFGVRAQADYLDKALTALRVPRATLVGVDIGAIISLRLALDRPERVDRVILVSPTSIHELPSPEIRTLQGSSAPYALSPSRMLMAALPLFREFLQDAVSDPDHMPARLAGRYFAPYIGRDGLNHLLTLASALEDDDLDDLTLADITQSVAVVRGADDRLCERDYAESLANDLPRGRFVEIPAAGRLVPEEAPDELVSVLFEDRASRREERHGSRSRASSRRDHGRSDQPTRAGRR